MIRSQQALLQQALLIVFFVTIINAFIPLPQLQQQPAHHHLQYLSFFNGWFGFNNSDPQEKSDSAEYDGDEVDGIYTGSKRIVTIPAKTMKSGGLRLYCSLYLMGLQNTPEKNTWKASQSDSSEVNLRYSDLSGSIIIRFNDDGIVVDRLGSLPSMKYLMHESMVLNGFLDELHSIVYEGDISAENRLLTLVDSEAIEKARDAVSFA